MVLGGCFNQSGEPLDTDSSSGTTGPAPDTAMVCIPGESRACACTNGSTGAQLCNADGSGFEACLCEGNEATGSSTGITEPTSADSTSSAGSSASTTSSDSSSSSTGPMGCTAIDFLFVVDNSGSRADEQANLIASFPAFIAGLEASLMQANSLHVGVVTTDVYGSNSPGCDVIGGLVTQTGGTNSSNAVCGPYAAGTNFMTEADDLSTAFSCAAQVGTSGSGIERPIDAMLAAIGPDLAMPGMCNEDFLRSDALLVLVIITDEWDGPNDPEIPGSSGEPASWYTDVVAAKGGAADQIVVLSLINYAGGPCPPDAAPFDGVHIADFTQMFGPQGILGGICAPDWSPFFDDTLLAIQNACQG